MRPPTEIPRAASLETALRPAALPPRTRIACCRDQSAHECAQGRNVEPGLSSVADVAMGELISADAVLMQPCGGRLWVGLFAPAHVGDFFARAQVWARVAVA